jgi:2-polyprenyl-6-methoxyphenol hydroxylase-like FAD-dependent oxidoreductase
MNTLNNKKIAIVGGGPGGLTLANLLQIAGAEVKVYERDLNRDVRVQGATLDLHEESGLKALAAAGLMDAFNANYRPGADKMCIMDRHAAVILDEHEDKNELMFRPEIDRGPLRKILLDSLHPDTVIWDSHFTSMTQTGDGWQLQFRNGTSATAHLVIAADGANSKIRPLITPLKPFYTGITALEGAVYNAAIATPAIDARLNGGKIFALGDEKTLIISAKGDGSLSFYVGFKAEETWSQNSGIDFADKAQVLAWFKQTFAGWDHFWLEVFENAKLPFIPRPQYCMPLDQTWDTRPNLTMLGDAAHLMPPYAGEGVNMAMLDALQLSEALTGNTFPDTRSAIAHYEKEMLKRFAVIGQDTLDQTASMHSPDALAKMINMFS